MSDKQLGDQGYRELGSGEYAKKVAPMTPISEIGISQVVGLDDQVDQYDFSASGPLAFGGTYSGEFLSLILRSSESGSGAIQTPSGTLIFLDADPAVAVGDTALNAAEWGTVIGMVDIAAADWISDANGGLVFKSIAIPFHALAGVWVVWYHTDATSLNSAAGDDEKLHLNAWYRRDS